MNKQNTKIKQLVAIFKETKKTQASMAKKSAISVRTFQRILSGERLKEKYYKNLAEQFEDILKRTINISDILGQENENEKKDKNDTSSFDRLFEDEFDIQRCNLYNVSDYINLNYIEGVINISSKIKIFLPDDPDIMQKDNVSKIIKEVMSEITQFKESNNIHNISEFEKNEDGFDKYAIDTFVDHKVKLPKALIKLQEVGLHLYVGNFHHILLEQYENDDRLYIGWEAVNYAILHFASFKEAGPFYGGPLAKKPGYNDPPKIRSFIYKNKWTRKKLNEIIKENILPEEYSPFINTNNVIFESSNERDISE
tara:strand:- start:299 stop:1231 length:933 start_codon:yes stop_codon:yes gene_type:complete